MKAAVYERFGPPEVLSITEVPKPVPQPGEVLVRIHATTVNRMDVHTREAQRSYGLAAALLARLVFRFLLRANRSRVLGSEYAGVVDAIGEGVSKFSVGDRVFGNRGVGFGAHAEYISVPETSRIARIPETVDFATAAAATDGGLNALFCLRAGKVGPGTKVLVYGGSGAIGTAGVQLARHLGADVTAVCGTRNIELVRSLGADPVLDYTKEDFTRNGETYDVIFDAVGKLRFGKVKQSLRPGGRYLPTDGFRNFFLYLWHRRFGDKKVVFQLPPVWPVSDMHVLADLMASGTYRPVIDRCYPLEDVVEASRYVESQRKTGNVVLTVA